MRDVPDDQPTQPGGRDRDNTTVSRQQDTPPAGYQVQGDDQPTEQRTVQGSSPPPPPPPPPPGDQDTEVGREAYGDETQAGRTVSDETRVGSTMEQDTQVTDRDQTRASSAQDDRAATTQAAVQSEPAPPSEGGDDEYKWHTDRTARSE